VVPEDVVTLDLLLLGVGCCTFSHLPVVEDVVLAVSNHLVGYLNKETSHSIVGVIVSSNSMDHLNTVHQSWKSVLDSVRGAVIEGFNEFFKGSKVLHVVLSLIKSFSDSQLDASPF